MNLPTRNAQIEARLNYLEDRIRVIDDTRAVYAYRHGTPKPEPRPWWRRGVRRPLTTGQIADAITDDILAREREELIDEIDALLDELTGGQR